LSWTLDDQVWSASARGITKRSVSVLTPGPDSCSSTPIGSRSSASAPADQSAFHDRSRKPRHQSGVQLLDIPITGSPTTPSGAAWLDAGLQVLADTP
jgi:hypothetical protein